jgi:hypothetical protein
MIEVLLWCLTACTCGLMAGSTYWALLYVGDQLALRLNEQRQLREAKSEMHLKALRAASREVE